MAYIFPCVIPAQEWVLALWISLPWCAMIWSGLGLKAWWSVVCVKYGHLDSLPGETAWPRTNNTCPMLNTETGDEGHLDKVVQWYFLFLTIPCTAVPLTCSSLSITGCCRREKKGTACSLHAYRLFTHCWNATTKLFDAIVFGQYTTKLENDLFRNSSSLCCSERKPQVRTNLGKLYSSTVILYSAVFNSGLFKYNVTCGQ